MLLALTVTLLTAVPAKAPKLAMPEWTRVDVTPELGAFYTEHFATALRAHGLPVVTAQEIAALLGIERQKQLLGCTDSTESCMAELGNALGCDLVVRVSVAKLPDAVRANIQVLSAVDTLVKTELSVATDEKRLFAELDDAAAVLADRLIPKPPMTKGTVRKLFWVPAAAGALGLVLGIAGAAGAQAQWNELDRTLGYPEARQRADEGKAAMVWSGVGFVLAGAGALAAALMYALGGPRELTPSVEGVPQGAHASLRVSF
jgi:hypothetical protein